MSFDVASSSLHSFNDLFGRVCAKLRSAYKDHKSKVPCFLQNLAAMTSDMQDIFCHSDHENIDKCTWGLGDKNIFAYQRS